MKPLALAVLALLPVVAVAQTILLKSSKPPPPFIELLDAGALVSCESGGAQPPQPCNQETGFANLANASASGTHYVFSDTYTLRRVVVDSSPAGNPCLMTINARMSANAAGTNLISGTIGERQVRQWEGKIDAERLLVADPTGSRCTVHRLQVWAQQ